MQPQKKTWVEHTLSLAPMLMLAGIILGLFYDRSALESAPFKEIILLVLGFLLGNWKEISSYYFGSSKGSAMKDQVIAEQSATANTVATTALAAQAGTGNGATTTDNMTVTATGDVNIQPEAPPERRTT